MREMGTGDFIVLFCAGALGGFAFLAISDFAIVRADWCIAGEADCLREWIGALSGWAAAIAAGATIVYLAGQMRETRRQTAFQIGDAFPTAELERTAHFGQVDVVITNWNRRTIEIIDILPIEGVRFGESEFFDPKLNSKRIADFGRPGQVPTSFTIGGWTDRNQPAPSVRVQVQMFGPDEGEIQGIFRIPVGARIKLRIIGAKYEHLELLAQKPDHLTI